MRNRPTNRDGFTYIEMLVSIVVIGIAVAGVLSVMNMTTRHSADPMIQQQAVSIAEAYLEEITLQPFADPDGSETGGAEAGESRGSYDDVSDYDGLDDNGARNRSGQTISGLGAYRVRVSVNGDALNGIGSGESKRIDVRVTHGNLVDLTLSSYRTDY